MLDLRLWLGEAWKPTTSPGFYNIHDNPKKIVRNDGSASRASGDARRVVIYDAMPEVFSTRDIINFKYSDMPYEKALNSASQQMKYMLDDGWIELSHKVGNTRFFKKVR